MTDGVVAFSRDGQLIHTNPAAARMLGRTIAPETTYEELLGPLAPLEEVLSAPDYLTEEWEGDGRYLQLLLAPFDRERQGGVLVVIHDVTEQRKNQEMQREFVANVSHELRTPLTNIRSYAETLSDSAGDIPPDMEKKFLGVILNESDRMTHIVQDLLTLSRFDSGRDDLKLTRFSFTAAVQDLYNAVYMEAQRHSHTLNLEIQPNMPEILADRERVVQVMMNIVSNSIKYTPDGGVINIYAGYKGDKVWMVVDDNGIGIPEKDRPRIFERFYRVDKARSRQSGGTGLGLSIAREIIQRHQGVLELVDKEGPGLAVRMELKIEGPSHGV
jgi:two-component system sensor histidine kinase VicK